MAADQDGQCRARYRGRTAFDTPFIGNPGPVDRLRTKTPQFDAPLSAYFGGGAEGYTQFTLPEANAA